MKAKTMKAETMKAKTMKAETMKAETMKAETMKAETMKAETVSEKMYSMLRLFVAQRSGIDWRDYSDRESYMEDYRFMLRCGADARRLISYAEAIGVSPPEFQYVSRADRLTYSMEGGGKLDFTTGQYFVTEYRAAACRVVAAAIRRHWRESGAVADHAETVKRARTIFGRGISGRWFE